MSKKTFLTLMGVLFGLGVVVHLTRLIFGWHIQLGGWVVPRWISLVAIIIAGYLSWTAFSLRKSD